MHTLPCSPCNWRVFAEQGVSFPEKRVLLAADSVGTREEPGSLDGSSPGYHHLYLLDKKRLVGMRVTEEFILKGFGRAVMDYMPPLVSQAETNHAFYLSMLRTFDQHLKHPDSFKAVFTDGIGISKQELGNVGFVMSAAEIAVPPLDATTREDYLTVLPEPVRIYMRPYGSRTPNTLRRESAEALFVQKYLKEGYVDRGRLRKLGLGINALPCVVQTRQSIREVSALYGGYIPFNRL